METQLKDLTKKRDLFLKKTGPQADDSIFVKDLGDLAFIYEDLKQTADKKKDEMKEIFSEFASTIKDDVRKTFVHFVSLLKNIEYDVNSEIEVDLVHLEKFDKEEVKLDDVLPVFEEFQLKDVKFDFNEASKMIAATKGPSLTESVIDMLGFNKLDVADEQNEMVINDLLEC